MLEPQKPEEQKSRDEQVQKAAACLRPGEPVASGAAQALGLVLLKGVSALQEGPPRDSAFGAA